MQIDAFHRCRLVGMVENYGRSLLCNGLQFELHLWEHCDKQILLVVPHFVIVIALVIERQANCIVVAHDGMENVHHHEAIIVVGDGFEFGWPLSSLEPQSVIESQLPRWMDIQCCEYDDGRSD